MAKILPGMLGAAMAVSLLIGLSGCSSQTDGQSREALQAADRPAPEPQRGTDNPGYIDPHAKPGSDD